MADLIIKGGQVVVADTVVNADVVVAGGKIMAIQADAPVTGSAEVIDARGQFVLPGSIDTHVHIHWPWLDKTTPDDFFTGTRAAALGGTTMVIDWAVQQRDEQNPGPEGSLVAAYHHRRAQIDGMTNIDYTLHSTLTVADTATLESVPRVIAQGATVLKLYMTYRKRGIMTDDGLLWDVLNANHGLGTIVSTHAENVWIHEHKERQHRAAGRTTAADFSDHKQAIVESEAVHRAIYLAEKAGTPIMIRHMSTADGVEFIRQARRRGFPAFAETCPQYLVLDDSVYQRPDGHLFICSPPPKGAADREAMWRAIADGTIDIIGSDHAAFHMAQKGDGKDAFDTPNGLPGVETRFPILFSEGFVKGRISLPRLVALTSTNAAKMYGCYPQKGVILPGSDADLVVVDPQKKVTLRAKDLHMDADWNPYEGMELTGYPVHVTSRGKLVVRDGQFCGERGWGQFVPGRTSSWKALDQRWRDF